MSTKVLCPYCMGEITAGAKGCPHCQRSFTRRNPAGALPVGTVLGGRYTVGEMLSIDGEGILYRGVENTGAFRVTIKEYLPITLAAERGEDYRLCPKMGSEVLFKTTRMDFLDLYRSVQRITPATGLEAVLDVLEENNTVYAVMESPGGKPLLQWLLEHGSKVSTAEAVAVLQPVAAGVAAMHQEGLVHRGISPENIRVLENGRARLTGYATIGLRTAGSGLHEQLYEGYSAPEQYSSSEFEGRYTDEYGLAAVFYRMVCGQGPVPAAQRVVADSNPTARKVEPTVPAYVSEVLAYGLQLRPVERIQTVPQLMDALASPEQAAALLQSQREADPQKDAEKGEKRGISLKSMLAAIILLLAVLLLLMLWGLVRLESDNGAAASEEPESVAESVAESTIVNYVPNFEGLTYAQVQNNRQYTSDYLFRVTEEYSDTAAAGIIIRQEPEAGAVLEDGETIRLVVSKGPQLVEMPSIIGFTQEGAIKELESRGLVPSCFMVVNDGSYASGCVVRCSTDAGTQLEVGSIVTVYIAAERDVQVTVTPEPDPEATETPDDTAEPLPTEGEQALPTGDVDTD